MAQEEYSVEDQRITKNVFVIDLGNFFLGSMRYFQVCHCVRDFPPFPNGVWDEYLYAANQLVERTLHLSLDVEFKETSLGPLIDWRGRDKIEAELEFTKLVDPITKRIRLDVEGDVWGMELGKRFPHLAETLFHVALGIRGFIDVC